MPFNLWHLSSISPRTCMWTLIGSCQSGTGFWSQVTTPRSRSSRSPDSWSRSGRLSLQHWMNAAPCWRCRPASTRNVTRWAENKLTIPCVCMAVFEVDYSKITRRNLIKTYGIGRGRNHRIYGAGRKKNGCWNFTFVAFSGVPDCLFLASLAFIV